MKDTERRRYEMLVRVRDFLGTRTASFPPATMGGQLFAALAGIVEELDTHATAQMSSHSAAMQSTTTKATARAALREDLEAIARTARVMALDTPGLEDRFRLPRNNNDQMLLSAARAFAADALPLKAQFIQHELPANFLEDLNADIADFEQAISNQGINTESQVAATEAIDSAIERGLTTVRKLHAVVRNKFADDAATLAAWLSASHVERPPRTKKPEPPPPPSQSGRV